MIFNKVCIMTKGFKITGVRFSQGCVFFQGVCLAAFRANFGFLMN
jgi:hypothetical protein